MFTVIFSGKWDTFLAQKYTFPLFPSFPIWISLILRQDHQLPHQHYVKVQVDSHSIVCECIWLSMATLSVLLDNLGRLSSHLLPLFFPSALTITKQVTLHVKKLIKNKSAWSARCQREQQRRIWGKAPAEKMHAGHVRVCGCAHTCTCLVGVVFHIRVAPLHLPLSL